MFMGPVPGMGEELVAAEVMLLDALFCQPLHHLGFGGNRCMVCARHPAGILAFHASSAHENILDGVVEHVSHVEHTGHVGWWNHHGIGLSAIRLATEEFVVNPILITFRFDLFRVVFAFQFH